MRLCVSVYNKNSDIIHIGTLGMKKRDVGYGLYSRIQADIFSVVNDDSPVKTEPLKVGSVMAQKI